MIVHTDLHFKIPFDNLFSNGYIFPTSLAKRCKGRSNNKFFLKTFLSLLLSSLIISFASASVYAETARVITKENAVRKSCRFFSPIQSKVKYSDELEIVSKEGDWYRVRVNSIEGCIHKTAVEAQKFSLMGLMGSKPAEASGEEVALAGKGFNPQVESSYRDKHPELDFSKVDRIEHFNIPEKKLLEFVKSGGLNLPE